MRSNMRSNDDDYLNPHSRDHSRRQRGIIHNY